MMSSFENYLIMVGIRSKEFSYSDQLLFENIELFRMYYNGKVSPYNALIFLPGDIKDEETNP